MKIATIASAQGHGGGTDCPIAIMNVVNGSVVCHTIEGLICDLIAHPHKTWPFVLQAAEVFFHGLSKIC